MGQKREMSFYKMIKAKLCLAKGFQLLSSDTDSQDKKDYIKDLDRVLGELSIEYNLISVIDDFKNGIK